MKARKRHNPEPIPRGVVIRTGSDEPPEDLKLNPVKWQDLTMISPIEAENDKESRECPHVVTMKRNAGGNSKHRNIGGLCFDEYGSGLPGIVVTRVTSLHMALLAQAKKDQLGGNS